MHETQQALLATLRAVQSFLDDKKEEVAPVNESGARKNLDDLVLELSTQSIDQSAGRANGRGETARQAQLRDVLRLGQMKPIAAIAKAHLGDVPEMKALALPPVDTSSARLTTDAGAMAEAAQVHKDVLIASGLPQDFITQLNTAAQALTASLDGRTQSIGRSTGATARISQLEKQARKLLRILDALVVPKLRPNDGLVREWRTMKAIQKKRGPAQGSNASGSVGGSSPASATPSTTGVLPIASGSKASTTPVAVPATADHPSAEKSAATVTA